MPHMVLAADVGVELVARVAFASVDVGEDAAAGGQTHCRFTRKRSASLIGAIGHLLVFDGPGRALRAC